MPPPASKLDQARAFIDAGKLEQAKQLLQRLLQGAPNDPGVNDAMRGVHVALGKLEQALYFAERAHKAAPGQPGFMADYGALLAAVGREKEALPLIERALSLDPQSRQGHFAYVALLFGLGRIADAQAAAERAMQHLPGDRDIPLKLAAAHLNLGEADRATAILAPLLFADSDNRTIAESLAQVVNYDHTADGQRVFQAHVNSGRLLAGADLTAAYKHPSRPPGMARPGKLRVGIISPDLRQHSVGFFAEPIIEHLDRSRFDLFIYDTGGSRRPDAMTARMQQHAATWRRAAGIPSARLAAGIHADQLDILIELSGLTVGHSLEALRLKPAPVQVTYLGFPNTTGLTTIDYRLVDSITDPPGAEALAVEKLIRLDPCFLCFRPPDGSPAIAAPSGPVMFASFNALTKVNASVLRLWSRVLAANPGSRLLLKNREIGAPDVQEHLLRRCAAAGIPRERIELLAPTGSLTDHLAIYNRVDVALDTFPYGGTTTTCEALWMGVPVVTLAGKAHAARVGLSLLSAVGEAGWAAHTEEEYVQTAAALALRSRDRGEREGLRRRVADCVLCDPRAFAPRFGAILDQMWAQQP